MRAIGTYKPAAGHYSLMSSTFVARINDEYTVAIEKNIRIKEGLEPGDYVEVTIRKVEKRPKSETGGPYSQ